MESRFAQVKNRVLSALRTRQALSVEAEALNRRWTNMPLVITLAILMALTAVAGYYMGPGVGYYGAASLCFVLLLVIIYRVFAGGPRGKGIVVRSEVEGPPDPPRKGPQ
jgi:hypothetical protein